MSDEERAAAREKRSKRKHGRKEKKDIAEADAVGTID